MVAGTPAPQGSKRHVGNGRMIEMSTAVGPWREAVKAIALADGSNLERHPVAVDITFYLKRPRGHYRTGAHENEVRASAPRYPKSRPDVDKLARSTLDGLTGVMFDDDCQVITLTATKQYAPAAQHPGAVIRIRVLKEDT